MHLEVHPEIERLKNKIAALKNELAIVVDEYELLTNHQLGNIQAKYMTLIGYEQFELLQLELSLRRLRRKIELVQSSINMGKPVIIGEIEHILEQEMQQWLGNLSSFAQELHYAQLLVENHMSSSEATEIKDLFRKLSKILHPDINPNLPERYKLIWFRVLDAYKISSLEELRSIELMLSFDLLPVDDISAEDELIDRAKKMEQLISEYINKIEEVKNKLPYTLLKIINDSTLISLEIEKIKQKKIQCTNLINEYANILKTMGIDDYVEFNLN